MQLVGKVNKIPMKNRTIMVIRVTAMLMIVICHICSYLSFTITNGLVSKSLNAAGLAFNVGVEIFFFMSGWQYSYKGIDDPRRWLKNRWRKLLVPAYIWVSVMLILSYFLGEWHAKGWQYVLTHLLNLQGWSFIFTKYIPSWIACAPGCGPLWFLTALMGCYFLMLFIKKFETNISKINTGKFVLYVLLGAILICAFAPLGICLEWFYIFFLGYFLRRVWKRMDTSKYIFITCFTMLAIAVRLFGKIYLDDTLVYAEMIVYLTHNVLAIWIIATISFINEKTSIIEKFAEGNLVQWGDKYSYEIYLVHWGVLYMLGIFSTGKIYLDLVFFVVLTILSAMVLNNGINHFLNKNKSG